MAWVERYVRADADGTGDGTTDANSGATGSWTIAQAIAGYAAGQRVNIKAGEYSVTGGLSFATAGTTTSPVCFRGYKNTIGDMDTVSHGTFMSGTEIPAFDLGSNRLVSTVAFLMWQNIDMRSSQTTNAVVRSTGTNNSLIRCRIECTAAAASGRAIQMTSVECAIISCWMKATTTAAACATISNRSNVSQSVIVGGSNGLDSAASASNAVVGCVFDSPLNHCIVVAASNPFILSNNVFYNAGADGVRFTGAFLHTVLINNIFSEIGGIGINNATGTNTAFVFRNRNAFHDITTSQEAGFGDTEAIEPITLTVDPFVDAAAGDFNINDTANGGALLRAATVVLP